MQATRQLCFLVKHWAKRRRLASPLQGTPSSYAWVLLMLTHLQALAPPMLPCLLVYDELAAADPTAIFDSLRL